MNNFFISVNNEQIHYFCAINNDQAKIKAKSLVKQKYDEVKSVTLFVLNKISNKQYEIYKPKNICKIL